MALLGLFALDTGPFSVALAPKLPGTTSTTPLPRLGSFVIRCLFGFLPLAAYVPYYYYVVLVFCSYNMILL